MAGNVNYEDLAADAIDRMLPNSKRTAHYRGFDYSPTHLLAEILKRQEVLTARLSGIDFQRFTITIETK